MRSWKKNDAAPCALSCALAVLALAACSRQPAAPAAPAAAVPAWNWLDFPRSERLVLAPSTATLEPAQWELLKAPREGWFVPGAGLKGAKDEDQPVVAGQVLGSMAPGSEKLDIEAEALHAKAVEVEAELRHLHEEEAKETFAEQERQARRDIQALEAALKLAADPALQRDILPQVANPSREEIDRIQVRLASAKERLEKVHVAGERQAALQKRQMELTDAKAAFERVQKAERDTLKASFAGRLRFMVRFEDAPAGADAAQQSVRRAFVRADGPLATVRDDAALWARVEIADASMLSVPADQLLFLFTAAGEPVEAPFSGRAPDTGAARPAPVYQFAVKEATPAQVRLVGGVVAGQLVQKLPQTAYLVPKIRLQVYRSDVFAGGDWAKDCTRVFPGCKVLAVGRDALAIVPGGLPAEAN